MTILALDFMNACHRARGGFTDAEHAVTYNFFRGLGALVKQFKPNRVYVALEGHPKRRHEALVEYKANRVVSDDDPRASELKKFFGQTKQILSILEGHFPVSLVRHPDYEADDTIANLIKASSAATDWVIVSSDSDFTQLLEQHKNVRLYNPVKKAFVESPPYSYVVWKALRGDSTDNIPGLKGVGDKTAVKMMNDDVLLRATLSKGDNAALFQRNLGLIEFPVWSMDDKSKMTSSSPTRDWSVIRETFGRLDFKSLTKDDAAWNKFVSIFEPLWG